MGQEAEKAKLREGHGTIKPREVDLEALRIAGEKIQALIAAAGTTEDEIVADFEKARRERRARQR